MLRTLPGILAALQEAPLSSVPSLLRRPQNEPGVSPAADKRVFDMFISHAGEDKNGVVDPLVKALQEAGLKVWYAATELRMGDSLRRNHWPAQPLKNLGILLANLPTVSDHFSEASGQ